MQAGQSGIEKSEMIYFFVLLGSCTVVYMLVMFNYRKISKWLDARLARPLAHRLITNNQFRSTLLVVGAVLFTVGFILQFSVLLMQ